MIQYQVVTPGPLRRRLGVVRPGDILTGLQERRVTRNLIERFVYQGVLIVVDETVVDEAQPKARKRGRPKKDGIK